VGLPLAGRPRFFTRPQSRPDPFLGAGHRAPTVTSDAPNPGATTEITMTTTLTGIQPTGELHLGNYAGAIRPLAQLAATPDREVFLFVADLHALNRHPEPAALAERTRKLVAGLLACGLDRPNVHVYRQSHVPAIARLAAMLGPLTAKGVLNRAHAYKAAVAENGRAGRDPDHGINLGLYAYPVLMAADILALDADEVPVGADQAQHLEITVDLAEQFARTYGAGVLRAPRALIHEDVAVLPGLDGRKMSKSYANTITLMAGPEATAKRIRRIVTDSTQPSEPKEPDTLVALLRAFADRETVEAVERRYRHGGIGYGEVKALLAEVLERHFGPKRQRYEELLGAPEELESRLRAGEEQAAARAEVVLARTLSTMGLYLPPT
jgi:tryptophanyl-tRNA synthetase